MYPEGPATGCPDIDFLGFPVFKHRLRWGPGSELLPLSSHAVLLIKLIKIKLKECRLLGCGAV
jgi:hypothetical protein